MLIAGVDEAGRGPLAGPVVAAAVILPVHHGIVGLADSKVLSAARRAALFEEIIEHALAYGIGLASVTEIDEVNIYHATFLAMQRAVHALAIAPDRALIDGNVCPVLPCATEAIVKGDAKVPVISAASILAKVTRDRMMDALHAEFPRYGFAQHRGYPTKAHLATLRQHGPCVVHRRSFRPVAALLEPRA